MFVIFHYAFFYIFSSVILADFILGKSVFTYQMCLFS